MEPRGLRDLRSGLQVETGSEPLEKVAAGNRVEVSLARGLVRCSDQARQSKVFIVEGTPEQVGCGHGASERNSGRLSRQSGKDSVMVFGSAALSDRTEHTSYLDSLAGQRFRNHWLAVSERTWVN